MPSIIIKNISPKSNDNLESTSKADRGLADQLANIVKNYFSVNHK